MTSPYDTNNQDFILLLSIVWSICFPVAGSVDSEDTNEETLPYFAQITSVPLRINCIGKLIFIYVAIYHEKIV